MKARFLCVFAYVSLQVLACGEGEIDRRQSIELTPRVLLRGVGDSVDLASGVASMARTGLIAVKRLDPPSDAVAIYSARGIYLHTVGRSGQGPGEFHRVVTFGFGPGDSLWVFDGIWTAHVFAPQLELEKKMVRTVRFRRPASGTLTSHGILAHAFVVTSGYYPPRLLSWEGADLDQFPLPDSSGPGDPQMGPVASASQQEIWIGMEGKYEVVRVGTKRNIVARVSRNVDWFPPRTEPAGLPWQVPPPPRIAAINIGSDNLLWVLIRRAHRNWSENRSKAMVSDQLPTPRTLHAIRFTDLFEGVIEVFDVTSGKLLATRDVSGGVLGFAAPNVLSEVIESASGEIAIQLFDVSLRR